MSSVHVCEELYYNLSNAPVFGNVKGDCVVLGKRSEGVKLHDWLSARFTDFQSLHPGDIISNPALFTFDEASEVLQQKVNADKPQRFRNYSHIVHSDGRWDVFTKAQKAEMLDIILTQNPPIVCIADSGQKHIFFKTRKGFWNFEGRLIPCDVAQMAEMCSIVKKGLEAGLSKSQMHSGQIAVSAKHAQNIDIIVEIENELRPRRGSAILDFALFLTTI